MSAPAFDNGAALITGASSGIGEEFARQLAPQLRALVLVARRADRLEKLGDELRAQHPQLQVHIQPADLSDLVQVDALCDWIEREGIQIDLLVNNAGLGDIGAFAASDLSRVKQMMLVNMVALTVLTRRLLPAMIARHRGAVLNVSSSASFLPIAGFAVYAASKAYVTSFSEALRAELRQSGVCVTALCPGPVHTEFTAVAQRKSVAGSPLGPELIYVTPEEVVHAALEGLTNDRAVVIPGLLMKIGMLLVRLTPMPILRLASRFSAKPS